EANASATVETINFSIPTSDPGYAAGPGSWTTQPSSVLPSITQTVTIDGSSQPGWVSTPVVEIDGSLAGAGVWGLDLVAGNVTIRSLAINGFTEDGIQVDSASSGATIVGNHIGLDPTGLIDLGNARGIELQSGSGPTTVGGTTAADRNVISGNAGDGIIVYGSDANTIIGNYIGTDATGNAPIPNDTDGISLGSSSSNNIIGQAGAGNVLSGNGNDGFEMGPGAGNIVHANHIGLGVDGTTVVANARHGIVLYDGSNTTQIGGSGASEGNVISGNTSDGVRIDGNANAATTGNMLEGNLIGTDSTGAFDRGNGSYGVNIFGAANANTVGGSTAAHGNVISGNGSGSHAGVRVLGATTSANVIRFNKIGTNAAGDAALLNDLHGVWIDGAPNTDVFDNLVSGNNIHGVYVDDLGSTGTKIYRNTIGTNAAVTAAMANGFDGIRLEAGSSGTTVGSPGNGNTISGNTQHGVNANSSSGNTVQANAIGTNPAATLDLGNGGAGVYGDVFNSSNNMIGGAGVADGNTIAYNAEGIRFESGTGNTFLQNLLHSNIALGIDLSDDGVTANDGGDGDTGPNDLLNFPVITEASESVGTVTVDFDLDAPAGDYRVEVFTNPSGADGTGYGEGEVYESAATISHTGSGVESFQLAYGGATGDLITLTATEESGGPVYASTSEFSLAVVAVCADSDSDGLCDLEEDANTDLDNDPATTPGPDTDGDTTPNYLDND
ncbi:MAG: hypothetical protein GY708_19775, partial [Actinomycetia bacterium]|nr:hypothetical protein [Actinomycetes bacterium]